MNYNFYFSTNEDAIHFVEYATEIAENYGHVSLADLYDLRGDRSTYSDNLFGWTKSSIVKKVCSSFNSIIQKHVVSFPEPDFHKIHKNGANESIKSPKSYIVKKEPTTSAEPLNITISMSEFENPWSECHVIVHEALDMAKQIKDRPVFITIC